MIYSQRDPQWAGKTLGKSGLTMGLFGCTTVCVAQALTLAGYAITPGTLCDALNRSGGYTADGLIIWGVVMKCYPQFHYGGQGYTFTQGKWGRFFHWCLQHDGKTYDPWYGTDHFPAGYQQISTTSAAIDPAPTNGGVVNEDQLTGQYSMVLARVWHDLNHKDPDMDSINREARDAAKRYLGGEQYAVNSYIDKYFTEAHV